MLEKWKQELKNHTLSKIMHSLFFSPSDINCRLAGKSPSHLVKIQLENHFHSETEGKTKTLNFSIGNSRAEFSKAERHFISTDSSAYKPPQGTWSPDKQGRQLTSKAGREPESSWSLGASTSKLLALATCLEPWNPRLPEKEGSRSLNLQASHQLWSWATEELDRWAGIGESGGNKEKKVRFPSKFHHGSYTVTLRETLLTRQIQVFCKR